MRDPRRVRTTGLQRDAHQAVNHKQCRALRNRTTINNANDFYIGKTTANLPTLRRIGFSKPTDACRGREKYTTAHAEETFQ